MDRLTLGVYWLSGTGDGYPDNFTRQPEAGAKRLKIGRKVPIP